MPVYLLKTADASRRQAVLEAGVRNVIPGLAVTASLEEVVKHAENTGSRTSIVVAILPQNGRERFEQLLEFATRHAHEMFLVMIGDEIATSDYKRVIRSGGADWVSAGADLGEVAEIVAQRQQVEASPRSARLAAKGRPITISFVPSAGGVGNATLAIETAVHLKTLKETRQREICIVDLDFQTSHSCDYLDSDARLQIAELSSAPGRLDEHLFESYRTRHRSGIDVFASPRSKFPWNALDIDALDALFTIIARRYDLVLIDYPVQWFSWTPQIIAASDAAIITGINTIPCLRQLCETLASVRSSGSTGMQIAIAINKCDKTLLGSFARRKHVETVLRDEQVFFIGNRPEAIESVNMGRPMMASSAARKLRKDLMPLVTFCAEVRSTGTVTA